MFLRLYMNKYTYRLNPLRMCKVGAFGYTHRNILHNKKKVSFLFRYKCCKSTILNCRSDSAFSPSNITLLPTSNIFNVFTCVKRCVFKWWLRLCVKGATTEKSLRNCVDYKLRCCRFLCIFPTLFLAHFFVTICKKMYLQIKRRPKRAKAKK